MPPSSMPGCNCDKPCMYRSSLPALAVSLLGVVVLGACGRSGHNPPFPDSRPNFGAAEVGPQVYFKDATIPDLTLPEATGGTVLRNYSLSRSLPSGLTFNAATRVISGTPAETLEQTEFRYTVRDADGDTDTLTFTLSVSSLTLDAATPELAEWNDPGVAITVDLSEPPAGAVTVTLAASGTADLGGDYELAGSEAPDSDSTGSIQVVIPAGAKRAATTVQSIRDFDEEGTESIGIHVESANGSRFNASRPSLSLELLDEGAMFADAKDRLTSATLVLFDKFRQTGSDYEFHFAVLNLGAAAAPSTTLLTRIHFEDFAPAQLIGRPLVSRRFRVPELRPGYFVEGILRLPNWLQIRWGPGIYKASATVFAPPDGDFFSPRGGFVDRTSFLIPRGRANPYTCQEFSRPVTPGAEDPLLREQWNLNNTGQTAFALFGGEPGEDLGMIGTLADGPTGRGVEIAIVDTGLEICHPDLGDNVSAAASYNFNTEAWPRSTATDPFNPSASGDHGTSVAGLIAATANNGIGIRGVAAGARIRGYNMLSAFGRDMDRTIVFDSLGASTKYPDSTRVDIFNMSFGTLLGRQGNASEQLAAVIENGVTNLRDGRGALYVKAAGNNFRLCLALDRLHHFADDEQPPYSPNDELGCGSANSDIYNNLPHAIAVGGFNARGKRSSYSSTGANLWVSAPAGESSLVDPSMVTTDQAGPHRGADSGTIDLDDNPVDPDGDYRSTFTGTSAAAPNTSGAIAVLLETQPELTWRDVKHILARTARKIDPGIEPIRIAFGGKPAALRHGWIANAAGYNFHNWYGFGAVSVDAAVELARTITPDNLGEPTRMEFEHEGSLAIPDNDGDGASQTLTVLGVSESADIEAVELIIRATHDFPNDLGVTLVSPAGTESIVNPIYNDALTSDPGGFRDWSLLSNAFYGENPNGDWTLRVIDAAPRDIGSLDGWTLKFSLGEHPE